MTTGDPSVDDRTLSEEILAALEPVADQQSFLAGERIFVEGDASDVFYLIDEGEVRIEVRSREVETDSVVAFCGAGSFLGEMGVLAGTPRSATAIAHSTVRVRSFSKESLQRLAERDPRAAMSVAWALGQDAASKLFHSSQQIAEYLGREGRDPMVDEMVATAVDAQRRFESWSEEAVDGLLGEIAEVVAGHAPQLAELALSETRLGNVADKVLKIRFASLGVFAAVAGKTGHGPIDGRRDPLRHQRLPLKSIRVLFQVLRARPKTIAKLPKLIGRPGGKVMEVVSPVGVVFAVIPVTEPVGTFVDNVLIALKGRNAIIVSSHRLAPRSTNETGRLIEDVLARRGAPAGVVQWVRGRTSRQTTARFMHHPDVDLILATGSCGLVKAAYSSGKPAIGVGQGNAPVWIAPDADVVRAARLIVESKTFDYGLVCGSEQHLVVDRSVRPAFESALAEAGAAILDIGQTERLMAAAFDPKTTDLRIRFVGKPATLIAAGAEVDVPSSTRLLVFRADANEPEGAAARERLAPLVSFFTVDSEGEAIALCKRILGHEGAGHTAVVHTSNKDRVSRFAESVPVSRILVNAPASQGCCGVLTGLFPSLTLGCGTFGGNSTTDNVGFANLVNIKRIAGMEYTNPALLAIVEPHQLAAQLETLQ